METRCTADTDTKRWASPPQYEEGSIRDARIKETAPLPASSRENLTDSFLFGLWLRRLRVDPMFLSAVPEQKERGTKAHIFTLPEEGSETMSSGKPPRHHTFKMVISMWKNFPRQVEVLSHKGSVSRQSLKAPNGPEWIP